MKNWPFRIGFVVIGAIVAIAFWQFYSSEQQAPVQVVAPPPTIEPPAKPVIQHPVTPAPEDLKAASPVIDLSDPYPN